MHQERHEQKHIPTALPNETFSSYTLDPRLLSIDSSQESPLLGERLLTEFQTLTPEDQARLKTKLLSITPNWSWISQILESLSLQEQPKLTFLLTKLAESDFLTYIHSLNVTLQLDYFMNAHQLNENAFQDLHEDDQKHFIKAPNETYVLSKEYKSQALAATLTHDIGKIGLLPLEQHQPSSENLTSMASIQTQIQHIVTKLLQDSSNEESIIRIAEKLSITTNQETETMTYELAIEIIRKRFHLFLIQTLKEKSVRDRNTTEIKIIETFFGLSEVPPELKRKLNNGKLSPSEHDRIKTHTIIGHTILQKFGFDQIFLDAALLHHQKYSGKEGTYPDIEMKEDQIPLIDRLMTIVDIFEALYGLRDYKHPYSIERSSEIITSLYTQEKYFDPRSFHTFANCLNRKKHPDSPLLDHDLIEQAFSLLQKIGITNIATPPNNSIHEIKNSLIEPTLHLLQKAIKQYLSSTN